MGSGRWSCLLLIGTVFWVAHSAEAQTRLVGWTARGDEIVKLVRENYYDPKIAAHWADTHTGYAKAVDSEEQFASRTNQVLSELRVSHTGYFTPADQKYYGLKAIFAQALNVGPVEWDSPGADFTSDNVVRVIFADGPAAKAVLRRGDKILLADGKKFHPVMSFKGRSGSPVALTVQRREHEPPITVNLTPRRINPKQEWLDAQRKGARLIAKNGKSVAYVPFFSCAGDEHRGMLEELLAGPLRDADALVLDFRDGFGGCNPQFLNLFNRVPPVLTQIGRDGKASQYDPQWRKRLVVLINGGTTSGKEIVAHNIKKHRLGPLVGQRTAGAVLGGRCFLLSDQSLMYLAVVDVRVDGEWLEGIGVRPDVEVPDRFPFADGADPQLDKAIDVAVQ
jgi:carboxyl-terminal processing protease